MLEREVESIVVLVIVLALCIVRNVQRIFRRRYLTVQVNQRPNEPHALQEESQQGTQIQPGTSSTPVDDVTHIIGDSQIPGRTSSPPVNDVTHSIGGSQIQGRTSSPSSDDDRRCSEEMKTGDIVMIKNQMQNEKDQNVQINHNRNFFQIIEFKDGNEVVVVLDFDKGEEKYLKRTEIEVTKEPIGLNGGDVVEITGQSDGSTDIQGKLMEPNGTRVVVIENRTNDQKVSVKRLSKSKEYDVDMQKLKIPEELLRFEENDLLKFVCDYSYCTGRGNKIHKGQIVEFITEVENSNLVCVTLDDYILINVSKYLLRIDLGGSEHIKGSKATLLCDYVSGRKELHNIRKNYQVEFLEYIDTKTYFARVITRFSEWDELPTSLLKYAIDDINEEIKYCCPGEIVEFAKKYRDASDNENTCYEASTKAMIIGHTNSLNKAIIEVFGGNMKISVPIKYLRIPEEVMDYKIEETLNFRHDFTDQFDICPNTWRKNDNMTLIKREEDSNQLELKSRLGVIVKAPNFRLVRPKTFFDFKEGQYAKFILPFKCCEILKKVTKKGEWVKSEERDCVKFKKGECVKFLRSEGDSHSKAFVKSRIIWEREEFCVPLRLLRESTKPIVFRRLFF